jgi:SAM-dependent methyltransferase
LPHAEGDERAYHERVSDPKRELRTSIAHPARVYDYWLGGKDNFEADRAASNDALTLAPEYLDYAVANRKFLVRATRFLVKEAGIRQFLDIGTGFPTSPNVHEIAEDGHVVYVDNDPMVFSHAQGLLAKASGVTSVLADLRDPDTVLAAAAEQLDLSQPVGLMFVACLHHIREADDPAGIVAQYLEKMAPGSYLVLSHGTGDLDPERSRIGAEMAEQWGLTFVPRSHDQILKLFNGRTLIDPGLVLVSRWRPDPDEAGYNADRAWAYGGVATL